ncbi:MAG: response regulator transcription factor [Actinobacteria bacterium]|nr:response regulator transcription factor [Actinomycetota bacterium]
MAQVEEIATVLICEKDERTLEMLADHLVADYFEVLPASTGADALRFCRYNSPDVLVLSLDLPDMPGLEVIRTIREADGVEDRFDPNLAIIALVGDTGDRARVIQLGADDYLARQPYSYDDLKERIKAILRRRHNRQAKPTRVGELLIDPARRKVTVGEREVHLAKKEFVLLLVLAEDPTRVFSKDELLRDVWGFKAPAGKTRTLDSHASRLRRKLDPDDEKKYVVNSWGIGYSLVAP